MATKRANLSLFVDESGTCGYGIPVGCDRRWVIAGVVAPAASGAIESDVRRVFEPVGRRHGLDCPLLPRAYHPTDIRRSFSSAELEIELLKKKQEELESELGR